MNPRVLRRFVILMGVLTLVAFTGWGIVHSFVNRAPGDYHTRAGDILLKDGKYHEAIVSFDAALKEMPNHRGALMGRGIAFLQSNRIDEAKVAFTYLIEFLTRTLQPDDPTGRGTLAAAYANRGILHDRQGAYEQALADYISALKTDEGALDGPSLFDKILYGTPRPATVRKRAIYLQQQLALPPDQRLLRVPEIDAEQRMHKP